MRYPIGLSVTLALVLGSAARSFACGGYMDEDTLLALRAVTGDAAQSKAAIAELRAEGPDGLAAMMKLYGRIIEQYKRDPAHPAPNWDRISAALDAVAAQKDAWASGLYWYTDLEAAKRAAESSGKPILSLRLLGTLDSEFSCANSRFFRTVLYPDPAVGKYLNENFVLHWQSHRPVPKLTIDFGDGRKIERTITGNSVHYVLTPKGQVVDVIPGLYGPAAFLRTIADARQLASRSGGVVTADQLANYHSQKLAEMRAAWAADVIKVGAPLPLAVVQPAASGQPQPDAMAATRIAVSKMAVEVRAVRAVMPERTALAQSTDDATWARIAALHASEAKLDAASRAVILSKNGAAVAANNLTRSKRDVEDPATRLIANFERSVAEDSVRNEYLLHGQVHEWFVNRQAPASLDELNERVYAQLFLMPKSDPFLGLVPVDTYTALPADARTDAR
jgi:hypothetical protein